MSNRLSCLVASNDYLRIDPLVGDQVRIEVYEADGSNYVHLNRDDFIDYLAENMNLTIIRNEELPPVERLGRGVIAVGEDDCTWHLGEGITAEVCRASARRSLAIAEYLENNPPVDEAQVEALASLISRVDDTFDVDLSQVSAKDLARRLVAAGVRVGGDDK